MENAKSIKYYDDILNSLPPGLVKEIWGFYNYLVGSRKPNEYEKLKQLEDLIAEYVDGDVHDNLVKYIKAADIINRHLCLGNLLLNFDSTPLVFDCRIYYDKDTGKYYKNRYSYAEYRDANNIMREMQESDAPSPIVTQSIKDRTDRELKKCKIIDIILITGGALLVSVLFLYIVTCIIASIIIF